MSSKLDLHSYRVNYDKNREFDFKKIINPFTLFKQWFEEFDNDNFESEVNAMTLSTINKQGFPKSRVVLLKEFDEKGFIFYSNYKSEKGVSIENNNRVCLSFFWEEHQRQVIIKGYAEKTSLSKSLAYFNSRPKGSKLGALVSNQSSVIDSKKILSDKLIELKDKFSDTNIPMPSNWGGYNVSPIEFEFWQGGNNRLHDRLRFKLVNNNWIKHRLSP
jgi:pyridoxamine 5'-phosphate oxidase